MSLKNNDTTQITKEKNDSGPVIEEKYAAGSVTEEKYNTGLVTEEKNDPGLVTEEKIDTSVVTAPITEEIEKNVTSSEDKSRENKPDFEFDESKYEVIDGSYHYTDETTNIRYKFDNESQTWENETNESKEHSEDVEVDSEGRTFYHAEGKYLCQDPAGNVYYMNENKEWVNWNSQSNGKTDDTKWYFYKGEDAFYRDQTTNVIYKLNTVTNSWEVKKSDKKSRKRKARQQNPEVEYDTSDSSDGEEMEEAEVAVGGKHMNNNTETDELVKTGKAPPGYKNDPTISYDGQIYLKTDKSDMIYEWDGDRRAWFPKIDDDFMARYQMNYGFKPDGSKDEHPVKYDDDLDDEEEEELDKKKELEKKLLEEEKSKMKPGWFEADDEHNTKVYVTNLPKELTEQEFVDLMQKCGLVLKDAEKGDYKVKLYKNKDGSFKGDALCTYIKVESVELALQILDEYCVGARNQKITVERAKFEMKGEYNAALKPKKKKRKLIEKIQRNKEKLFAWTPDPLRGQRGKYDNVVIIRNAFDPKEFIDHAEKILTHTESLRAQCTSFGSVRKLELFDRHLDGIVKIIFDAPESADMCIASMNNRLYNSRKLSVNVWDGVIKFKVEETKEEEEARLKKWDEYLNKGEGEGEGKSTDIIK